MARLKGASALEELADRDLIIEAVTEDMTIKSSVFEMFNDICKPARFSATNTSSLSVTEMASASGRPDRFLGMHFFDPVPQMKLVEVIRAIRPHRRFTKRRSRLSGRFPRKKAVRANDTPGFYCQSSAVPYLNDAARVFEQGLASAEDIDNAMKLGAGHPMGRSR